MPAQPRGLGQAQPAKLRFNADDKASGMDLDGEEPNNEPKEEPQPSREGHSDAQPPSAPRCSTTLPYQSPGQALLPTSQLVMSLISSTRTFLETPQDAFDIPAPRDGSQLDEALHRLGLHTLVSKLDTFSTQRSKMVVGLEQFEMNASDRQWPSKQSSARRSASTWRSTSAVLMKPLGPRRDAKGAKVYA